MNGLFYTNFKGKSVRNTNNFTNEIKVIKNENLGKVSDKFINERKLMKNENHMTFLDKFTNEKKIMNNENIMTFLNKFSEEKPINSELLMKCIKTKVNEAKKYRFSPVLNQNTPKILTIIACNSDTKVRLDTIINNLLYLNYLNNDIIIVNTSDTPYGNELKEKLSKKFLTKQIFEIPNDNSFGFEKWIYGLNNYDYTKYDYVVFTNDSFIIKSRINCFFNKMIDKKVELFGYNDSTQIRYHYQSYLFGIKNDAIHKFISYVEKNKCLVHNYDTAVLNYELVMTDYFSTKDCFLSIGYIPMHKGMNIFFTNDVLYNILFKTRLLPFIKVKRLL
jgi:hypothetical protein